MIDHKKIEISFSPALYNHYFHNPECIVVVVDVFRATSAICSAIENGVEKVIPVASVDEAKAYKEKGFIVGAERQGEIVEGFDFGNSPLVYTDGKFKGKTIVLTTTNGTKAIDIASNAQSIVIGAFNNISALTEWLNEQNRDVLIQCAGWRNRFNLEDTLFAGALTSKLSKNPQFTLLADSALAARHMYDHAKNDIPGFLENSSHRRRLKRLQLEKDIDYCLTEDQTQCVPIFVNGAIVDARKEEGIMFGES